MPQEQERRHGTDPEQVARETREAGQRAQGGGSADEEAIRRAAQADGEGGQPSRSSDSATS